MWGILLYCNVFVVQREFRVTGKVTADGAMNNILVIIGGLFDIFRLY